ncbi:hypothetical protein HY624_01470 [Candidatus Uhrbacteria bacterium]|nr:hypothetical protein [Candidatus Uhrbacteria bacterium]
MRATKTNLHTYVKAYERYMPALQTIWNLDSFVAAAVRHAMHRKFHAPAVEELMDTLNIPLQNNFYKQEECDLLNTRDLHAHVRKYDWIHSRYGEVRPYTIAEARAKRAGMDKTALIAGWRKEKRKVRRAIRDAKRMLGSRAYLIDLLQFIIYYRTQRTDIINKSSYLFAPKLARFAHARGLTYDQMLHCTKDEVLQGAPSRTILNARIRHHATIIDRGGVSVLAGKDYDRIKAFVDKDVARVNRFSGSVASPGRVTGIVKIILGRDDFSKIKKGDILVAGMTTPQMLPIMKKAGAFVTDEGGITCHAAIISRELKKPCIIGTKVATRVLKDGDRVEVDAERGIVRRL